MSGELGYRATAVAGEIEGRLSSSVPSVSVARRGESEIGDRVWRTSWNVTVCRVCPASEQVVERHLRAKTLVIGGQSGNNPVGLPHLDELKAVHSIELGKGRRQETVEALDAVDQHA